MNKNLKDSEKEEMLLLCHSEAIKRFPYPDDDFFDGENIAKLVVGGKPKSTQLNGLWQMALNAKDIDEIWEFLVQALIYIREFKYRSCRFLDDWLDDHIVKINDALRDNDFDERIDPEDIELSNKQRLELARSFIHRFVTLILVERKIREVK